MEEAAGKSKNNRVHRFDYVRGYDDGLIDSWNQRRNHGRRLLVELIHFILRMAWLAFMICYLVLLVLFRLVRMLCVKLFK
jgi:hypothetical protein